MPGEKQKSLARTILKTSQGPCFSWHQATRRILPVKIILLVRVKCRPLVSRPDPYREHCAPGYTGAFYFVHSHLGRFLLIFSCQSRRLFMRILIITDSYPPETRSSSHLMGELAEGLNERGHEVFVVTSRPAEQNLPQGTEVAAGV